MDLQFWVVWAVRDFLFSILLEHSIFEDSVILAWAKKWSFYIMYIVDLHKREKNVDFGFNLYFLGQNRLILIIQNMSVKR